MSLFIKRRLVFHKTTGRFFSNKRKNQYDYNSTIIRRNPHAYARITWSFIVFTVTSVTVLQQYPNKQHVITIFRVKPSRFILHIIERRLFQRFILRLIPPFFCPCVTLVTAKNQKPGWNARAYARAKPSTDFISKLICTLP